MNDEGNNLIQLKKDQIVEASRVAGRAFFDYPTSIHMFPDEKERAKRIEYGFYFILKYGKREGLVMTTSENLEGIAIWLPPDKIFMSAWQALRSSGLFALRKTGLKAIKRGNNIYNYVHDAHKRLVPFDHWYLQCIAIDPKEQGKGYGSLLLKTMFTRLDQGGMPIYLETNTEDNALYYQNLGFKVLEHVIIPGTDLPNWCMLRKPQSQ